MTSKQRITINCCGVDAIISLPKGSSVYLRIEDVEFQFKSKKEEDIKREFKELVALHRKYKKQTKKAIEQLSELDDDEEDDEDMDLSEEGDDDVDSWCDEVIRLINNEEEVEIQSGHIVLDI